MFEEMNRQLMEISEKIRNKYKVENRLKKAQKEYQGQKEKLDELEGLLQKEGEDVEKLEGLSLTGLFYTILGTKDDKMEKERQEYLAAKLKYDECREGLTALEKEIQKLKLDLGEFGALERQYEDILRQKEEMISQMNDSSGRRLVELSEELANARADAREIKEAIDAGRAVLGGLERVIDSLRSAKNWGTWDMVGGGMISTAIKHSKIDDARSAANHVQHLLRRFQRELQDVGGSCSLDIEIGSFATFADYFFDGLIADWVVQSRINNSLDNAYNMARQVEGILSRLQSAMADTQRRINKIEFERKELIEKAK